MSISNSESSIQIKIRFFSSLRSTTGIDQIEIPINKGDTVLNVLHQVENKYFIPKNAQLLDGDTKKLAIGTLCLIDDVDVSLSGGLNQKVNSPLTITLISSIHGG
ncbi:MAG: MoaD/ThiS family protein [Promethearchaeota archaeon]